MNSKKHISENKPPSLSKSILSDIMNFFINKPKYDTFIKFDSSEERYQYNNRIIQRIGVDTDQYSVLNINKIGIDAPVNTIFNELILFDGNPRCWPNHIAKVDRINDDFKNIRMLPFGWKRYPFKSMKSFLGLPLIPLFLLKAIRVKEVPDNFDFDNARYVLYECSGGYPIGFLAIYIRSSIPEMGETTKSQLVFGVGFNFFGKKEWQGKRKFIHKIWESLHNRVTANVLNRIKKLSEWRLESTDSFTSQQFS